MSPGGSVGDSFAKVRSRHGRQSVAYASTRLDAPALEPRRSRVFELG